jgi:ribosomal protein S27AE
MTMLFFPSNPGLSFSFYHTDAKNRKPCPACGLVLFMIAHLQPAALMAHAVGCTIP